MPAHFNHLLKRTIICAWSSSRKDVHGFVLSTHSPPTGTQSFTIRLAHQLADHLLNQWKQHDDLAVAA